MFRKRQSDKALELPPIAADADAVEVLRAWAVPDEPQQVTLRTTWKDPAVWGFMLVDLANHAANAYANEGHDRASALARIYEAFDAVRSDPTDKAEDITPR